MSVANQQNDNDDYISWGFFSSKLDLFYNSSIVSIASLKRNFLIVVGL